MAKLHPRPHSPEPEVGVGAALGLEAPAGLLPSKLCCAFTGSAARKTSDCPVTHVKAQGESLPTPMGPAGTRLVTAPQRHPPATWARPWAGQSGTPTAVGPTQRTWRFLTRRLPPHAERCFWPRAGRLSCREGGRLVQSSALSSTPRAPSHCPLALGALRSGRLLGSWRCCSHVIRQLWVHCCGP